MTEDYRSDLAAAQAHVARLQAELAQSRGADVAAIAALEAEHDKLSKSGSGWKAWLAPGSLVLTMLSSAPSCLAYDAKAIVAISLPVFAFSFLIGSILIMWETKNQTKRQVALSARRLEEARHRYRLEQELALLRPAGLHVRVGEESPPSSTEEARPLEGTASTREDRART